MADAAKSRKRQPYEYQPGEHVWVNSTYFDDLRAPKEERYSTLAGGDGKSYGIVRKKIGSSYKITFDDGSETSVPLALVNLTPRTTANVIHSGEDAGQKSSSSDDSDTDFVPNDLSGSSESDDNALQPTHNDPSSSKSVFDDSKECPLKDSEEVYLSIQGKDILKGTYQVTDDKFVHGQELDENHGRFFITKVMKDAGTWKKFDPEVHCVGSAVMWKLANIRRMIRTPFSKLGTEATYATPLPKPKRKRNPEDWQVKKRKIALNSGKVFTWKKRNGEVKTYGRERKVGELCKDTCKKRCKSITDEERELIHKSYWKMGSAELQRGFLLKYVRQAPKARERKGQRKSKSKESEKENNPVTDKSVGEGNNDTPNSEVRGEFEAENETSSNGAGVKEKELKVRNRNFTRHYHFKVKGQEIPVCAYFFLKTLDIDEKRLRSTLATITDTGTFSGDNRGHHENHRNAEERMKPIIAHISKFKTVESHYVRKTAKCQYLPKELTVREMHRMYVAERQGDEKAENYAFYFSVFSKRFNLKFQKNKKDKCNQCESFQNTPEDIRTEDQKEKQDLHLDEKENAREFKQKKKEEGKKNNVITAAFDLEKVLLCPYGQTSSFYYSKRLKLHNFTITDIEEMVTHCYVWHEGEADKGSREIGTCL